MKIAIRGHDVCGKGNIADISDGLRNVGLDALQLVAYKSFSAFDYVPGSATEEKAVHLGAELKEHNIAVALIGAYFNPVHSNKEKAANGKAVFKEYLKQGKNLGCSVVGSETGSYNDDKWTYNPLNRTEEARKIVVETFTDLCDEAKKYGASVAIEGAAGHVLYDVKTIKLAFDEINKDNIKIIFDLYNFLDINNAHSYMDILEEGIETFGKQIYCFHIKDCMLESGGKPVQCPVGKGDFDFKAILSRIKVHNENPILILEGTTGEHIKPAVDFLKNAWQRL